MTMHSQTLDDMRDLLDSLKQEQYEMSDDTSDRTTTDSLYADGLGLLDELQGRTSEAATGTSNVGNKGSSFVCAKCHTLPAPDRKVRYHRPKSTQNANPQTPNPKP